MLPLDFLSICLLYSEGPLNKWWVLSSVMMPNIGELSLKVGPSFIGYKYPISNMLQDDIFEGLQLLFPIKVEMERLF